MPDHIRYLDTATVVDLLERIDVVEVVEAALKLHASGRAVLPEEAYLRWTAGDGWARSLTLPAALGAPPYAAGVKVINGNTSNPGRGIDRASGLVLLFDVLTGQVSTIMAAAPLSAIRTAAVSIAGLRRLTARPIEQAVVIGAGPIGEAHVQLLGTTIPTVRIIWIHDSDINRAAGIAERARVGDVEVRVVSDRAAALRTSEVVIAATTSAKAHLGVTDVAPGTVVVNVGLDDCDRNLLLKADHLVVDSWDLVAGDTNRLLGQLIKDGLVVHSGNPTPAASPQRVCAELGHLVAGTVTIRPGWNDRVVLNPFGMAVNDIAVATVVEQMAKSADCGQHLRP
ncbi:hypothetical protein [Frankia sp. AgB32]|uniref:hypothetical protein n=1 Tax=Frankia sp. AgB32 TaxID=631119 RepID=UPI00200DAC27|nr:hypothetical protein [Frankia sp. AgB32]MCK9896368.1 hypothetical protein [Frankia sp. AgB32]